MANSDGKPAAKSAKGPKRVETRAQIPVADMPSGRSIDFDLVFDQAQLEAAQEKLDILGVQKLRLTGTLSPRGRSDWSLKADLGATITQACVVTLDPVKTRLDETVTRTFVADWHEPDPDTVVEMPEDVDQDPLGTVIDLEGIAIESVALAMPDYPRSESAALEESVFAEPGVKPMSDEDAKPFAGLAALKEKMDKS
ncbi:YceD family protein [Neptunicoccus sediminis]|uniref:YceD family protein n=1 Tax=Neptunicoccus sediminis TaxID=1892596 RepID=UPI0009F51B38|nr:DUF177 domain-containing protein [Neptunicoccus sediminis]